MIIAGHAHTCGEPLHAENVVRILDANQVDKIVLVPGEMNNEKNYHVHIAAHLHLHFGRFDAGHRRVQVA